jgi:hypothetical protein
MNLSEVDWALIPPIDIETARAMPAATEYLVAVVRYVDLLVALIFGTA